MKSRLMMIAWLVLTPWPLSATEAVRVDFVQPERYIDLSLSGSTTERIQTHVLEELKRYLQELAARGLPPSHTLHVTVYDLDMAGEYEPWRVPDLTNTRFIRDVYRPRIALGYVGQDEHGRVACRAARAGVGPQLPDAGRFLLHLQRPAALREGDAEALVR